MKILIWTIITSFALMLLLLISLPSLASTQLAKSFLLSKVNAHFPGKLELNQLHLSWLGPQKIDQLQLSDPNGQTIVVAEQVTSDNSLITFIFTRQPGNLTVTNLNATLTESSLQSTFGADCPIPCRLFAGLQAPLMIKNVNGHLSWNEELNINVTGSTLQDNSEGQFKIVTTYNLDQAIPKELNVEIQNFPVALIDLLLSMKEASLSGLMKQFVGEKLNIHIAQKASEQATVLEVQAHSEKIKLEGLVNNDQIAFSLDSERFVLPRAEFRRGAQQEFVLQQPVRARWLPTLLEGTRLPLKDDRWVDIIIQECLCDAHFQAIQLSAEALQEPFHLTLKGTLEHLKYFNMAEPLQVSFQPNDDALVGTLGLANLTLQPTRLPLNMEGLLESDVEGTLRIDSWVDPQHTLQLRNIEIPFSIDGSENTLKAHFAATSLTGKVQGELSVNQWHNGKQIDFPNAFLALNSQLTQFPVAYLSRWLPSADLDSIFGKTFDLSLNFDGRFLNKQPIGTGGLNFAASDLKGTIHLDFNQWISISDSKPTTLGGKLTPEAFQFVRSLFKKDDHLHLIEPSYFSAQISAFKYDPLSKMPLLLEGDLKVDQVHLENEHRKQISLENLALSFSSPNISQKIFFQLAGTESNTKTPFSVSGNMENALTPKGKLNLRESTLELKAHSKLLPIGFLCQIACVDADTRSKIEALFGHTLEADLQIKLKKMNGSVVANVQGENGWLALDGTVQNGMLTLNKPFEMQVKVTPQLGESLLLDVMPLLAGALQSNQPIKIAIQPDGFILPVHPFELTGVQISSGSIELGQMLFSPDSQLATMLALLKPNYRETLPVWFTPLYFSLAKGKITVQRMDLLVLQRFPMAVWGKVNVVKDKVDMRIGLTGAALTAAFTTQSFGSREIVLQLPLTGTLKEAKIDPVKATARISSLVAQSQGGTPGLILGTILGIAGGSLKEDPVPEPTTQPLPW